jgi:PDZ domain-containing protein/uncharacterized protein DUF4189
VIALPVNRQDIVERWPMLWRIATSVAIVLFAACTATYADGNVIGVNSAIFSPSGGSVGIGFDIPADTAKMVVAQLKETGHATPGWFGVKIRPVNADIADRLGLKEAAGALVVERQSGSPAAKAGIESGDVITAVNGTQVKDALELARTIGTMAPDTSMQLDIVRNGAHRNVTVTLAQMPNEQRASTANDNSGLGSLAVGICDRLGFATGYDDVEKARASAIDACAGNGDKSCRIVLDIQGDCAAFAVSGPCGARGWAKAATRAQAEAEAVTRCSLRGGQNCTVKRSICDGDR